MTTPYEPIDLNGMQVHFLLDADDTGGTSTMFEVRMPKGSLVPPPHAHDQFAEAVYGVRGTTTYVIDDAEIEVTPGTALVVRPGQVHSFENRGDDDAAILVVSTPGLFGPSYFRDIAAVLSASAGGPPDRDAIIGVMHTHGLRPVAPAMG